MSLCYISFVLIFALIYQEANTEKILYGLDDIKRARDIIIVEGEIDKLSMEEAGYRNCVSVPDGAPPKVSSKLPDKDQVSATFCCCQSFCPSRFTTTYVFLSLLYSSV
jgi:hypothetical protein